VVKVELQVVTHVAELVSMQKVKKQEQKEKEVTN